MEKWVGKVAVVTGASAGIGAAICKKLADRGVIVVGLARRKEKLEEVAASTKGKIWTRVCDVQKEEDILAAFRWIEATLGGVDILVNNVGLANAVSLIDGNTSQWQAMIKTNVEALTICTREALKTMRTRGDNGHIIHMNSVAGHIVPGFLTMPLGIYTATKHAVTALTEALRIELIAAKSKIRVSSLSPGAVHTDMLTGLVTSEEVVATNSEDSNPDESMLVGDDIAEAIVYILSTRSIVQIHELTIMPVGQLLS